VLVAGAQWSQQNTKSPIRETLEIPSWEVDEHKQAATPARVWQITTPVWSGNRQSVQGPLRSLFVSSAPLVL